MNKRTNRQVRILIIGILLAFGIEIQAQTYPSSITFDIEWESNGQRLAIADTDGIRIVDGDTNEELFNFPVQSLPVWEVAWSPDGSRIATAEQNGIIEVWNTDTKDSNVGQLSGSLVGHLDRVSSMDWSSDGQRLVSSNGTEIERSLRTWDVISFLPLDTIEFTVYADVAWSADNSQIYIASTLDGILRIDVNSLARTPAIEFIGPSGITAYDVAIHPTKQQIAFVSSGGFVYVWDSANNEQIHKLSGHTDAATSVDWNSDGSRLASVGLDNTLRIWNPDTGIEICSIPLPSTTLSIDWHPDDMTVTYAHENTGCNGITSIP